MRKIPSYPFPLFLTLIFVFGIFPPSILIPDAIDLVAFKAAYSQGQVLIEWETATEINIAGFYLKRSTTLAPLFEDISGFIPAEGSGVIGAEYDFIDLNIDEGTTYYYVLEIVDTSQNIEYSKIISVYAGNQLIYLPLIQNNRTEVD